MWSLGRYVERRKESKGEVKNKLGSEIGGGK